MHMCMVATSGNWQPRTNKQQLRSRLGKLILALRDFIRLKESVNWIEIMLNLRKMYLHVFV